MKVEKIPDVRPAPKDEVTLKTAGNVMEIRYASNTAGSPIQKLDKDHGLDTRTGEVIDYQHNQNRAGDMASVAQSLKRLRDLINANLENPDTALWVTLTYAENMTDAKRLVLLIEVISDEPVAVAHQGDGAIVIPLVERGGIAPILTHGLP